MKVVGIKDILMLAVLFLNGQTNGANSGVACHYIDRPV